MTGHKKSQSKNTHRLSFSSALRQLETKSASECHDLLKWGHVPINTYTPKGIGGAVSGHPLNEQTGGPSGPGAPTTYLLGGAGLLCLFD